MSTFTFQQPIHISSVLTLSFSTTVQMLLKKQRNELFEILVSKNLQPADFTEINLARYQLSLGGIPFTCSVGERNFGLVAKGEVV